MGRKNFLFHDNVKGARASAIVYTLAETAKANELNIRLYLETVLTKMLALTINCHVDGKHQHLSTSIVSFVRVPTMERLLF